VLCVEDHVALRLIAFDARTMPPGVPIALHEGLRDRIYLGPGDGDSQRLPGPVNPTECFIDALFVALDECLAEVLAAFGRKTRVLRSDRHAHSFEG